MPEQLLTVLKFCLLALLYLFFLRVIRAIWSEVSPRPATVVDGGAVAGATGTRSAKSGRPGRKARRTVAPSKLVVVEPASRVGAQAALGPDLTVGRAAGCSLVFDERYVSQVHARIFVRDGSVFVEDLGSTNGTWVNGSRVVGQMPARLGDRIQVGNVVLEVR